MPDKLTHIYLNDHLGASTAGIELTKRCLSNNNRSSLGEYLKAFLGEITEDQGTVESVLRATGGMPDRYKSMFGWIAEKLGRLKPNGQLRGYSDLSRVLELEGLSAGVEAKKAMWVSFRELDDPRLSRFDFDSLIRRATDQRAGLERFRVEAARKALS